jgi:hypothetical protein
VTDAMRKYYKGLYRNFGNIVVTDQSFSECNNLEEIIDVLEDKIFGMFDSLKEKYDWVLEPWEYKNKDHLIKNLQSQIVGPCEKKRKIFDNRKRKNERMKFQNRLPNKLRSRNTGTAVAAKAKGE